MISFRTHRLRAVTFALILLMLGVAMPALPQNSNPTSQLPEEFRGIKVYKLPTKDGQPQPNFGIYRKLTYKDINFERLQLALTLSIRAVDHPATVEHIYFQDLRANGVPIHVETYNQAFKLSNNDPVDVPSPIDCAIVFADLDSLQPVRDLVEKDSVLITGQSYIELKLSTLESVAAFAHHVVVPVPLQETVPLRLFDGKPLLHITATTILDNLVTPTSTVAINMAKEHLAKLRLADSLGQKVKSALCIVMTQYQVRDPKSGAVEQFSQSGTGFLVSADGKLLTAKRVVSPWKYDPEVDFLIEHKHMMLDKGTVKTYVWPAGALVMGLDGQPDLASALSTDHQSVKLLRTAADEIVQKDYADPASGKRVKLHLFAEGQSDVALLQLSGTDFQPLTFSLSDPLSALSSEANLTLCSYPFGMSQPQATPRLLTVHVVPQGNSLKMGHPLDPGESGAPLVNSDGKVVAVATSGDVNIPIQAVQSLIP